MTARRKPMSEINVVPYIDVMLVLLVIFMATAPLLTQGVQVDLDAEDEGTRVTVFSLEDQAGKVLRARPDVPVYVKADHTLDYGKVVGVMTVLQKAGAESVGLITDPPDLGNP
jgi:biopolymer transport protein TolR